MEHGKSPNSHRNVDKENQSWWHHNAGLQAILQSCNHQTVWYWHKNRHIDQQNRIEKPKNGPSTLWSTNLWQSRKEYPMEKRWSFQQMMLENWTATCERVKLNHFFLFDRERDSQQERKHKQGEWERKKQAPSRGAWCGTWSQDSGIMPWVKSRRLTTESPRHPDGCHFHD